jgi:hypothetical protein
MAQRDLFDRFFTPYRPSSSGPFATSYTRGSNSSCGPVQQPSIALASERLDDFLSSDEAEKSNYENGGNFTSVLASLPQPSKGDTSTSPSSPTEDQRGMEVDWETEVARIHEMLPLKRNAVTLSEDEQNEANPVKRARLEDEEIQNESVDTSHVHIKRSAGRRTWGAATKR